MYVLVGSICVQMVPVYLANISVMEWLIVRMSLMRTGGLAVQVRH